MGGGTSKTLKNTQSIEVKPQSNDSKPDAKHVVNTSNTSSNPPVATNTTNPQVSQFSSNMSADEILRKIAFGDEKNGWGDQVREYDHSIGKSKTPSATWNEDKSQKPTAQNIQNRPPPPKNRPSIVQHRDSDMKTPSKGQGTEAIQGEGGAGGAKPSMSPIQPLQHQNSIDDPLIARFGAEYDNKSDFKRPSNVPQLNLSVNTQFRQQPRQNTYKMSTNNNTSNNKPSPPPRINISQNQSGSGGMQTNGPGALSHPNTSSNPGGHHNSNNNNNHTNTLLHSTTTNNSQKSSPTPTPNIHSQSTAVHQYQTSTHNSQHSTMSYNHGVNNSTNDCKT
jgi:hypothetical protein